MEVTHFLWPLRQPLWLPVMGSQSQIMPFMSPLATHEASGAQATTSTQFLCPWHVCSAHCVLRFQKRTHVSPEPVARCFPSGLKLTDSTASAWPGGTAQGVRQGMMTGRQSLSHQPKPMTAITATCMSLPAPLHHDAMTLITHNACEGSA